MASVILGGCGASSLIGSAATTTTPAAPSSPSTTVPTNGEIAVAFPVVACTTPSGAPANTTGWKPTVLLAPIPTSLVGKVAFYTDGTHTVLGPVGWSCTQTINNSAANAASGTSGATGSSGTTSATPTATTATVGSVGALGLVVYPSTDPSPPTTGVPAPGTEGVFAEFDTTGTSAGVGMVCPFFSVASFQKYEAHCPTSPPTGEAEANPTPDIASVKDAAGAIGSLAASGGRQAATGSILFPQITPNVTEGLAVHVAVEVCSLVDASLCPTILSDFDVREFPTPQSAYSQTYSGSGSYSSGSSYGGTTYAPSNGNSGTSATDPTTTTTPATATTHPASTTTTAG